MEANRYERLVDYQVPAVASFLPFFVLTSAYTEGLPTVATTLILVSLVFLYFVYRAHRRLLANFSALFASNLLLTVACELFMAKLIGEIVFLPIFLVCLLSTLVLLFREQVIPDEK